MGLDVAILDKLQIILGNYMFSNEVFGYLTSTDGLLHRKLCMWSFFWKRYALMRKLSVISLEERLSGTIEETPYILQILFMQVNCDSLLWRV